MALDCNNITSLKRNLVPGSTLLLGDQIVDGEAVFQGGTPDTTGISEEELLQNQAAAEVFDIELSTTSLFNTGDTLGAGEYITEPGFCAGPNGIEVIHSGYGGDARIFAAGAQLQIGDIVVNGKIISPDGVELDAPVTVDKEGYKVGEGGAIVTPGGAESDDAYCSLQELAGKPKKVID